MARILHKFKLDEISSVDRPAQAGAKLVLMKRDNTELAKGAFKDALRELRVEEVVRTALDGLWETQAALREAICEIVEDAEKYPDPQKAITEALAEFSVEVKAMVAAAASPIADAVDSPEPTKESEPMSKTVEQLELELQDMTSRLTKAEALARLNDVEKAYMNALPEGERDAFLKQDAGARANVLAKAAEANPVIYTTADGIEFRKNDDPRFVSMAKQADEDRKIAKAAEERATNLELAKRASDELGNLPGNEPAKVALLKAINGIPDEAMRGEVAKLLKAGNEGLAVAFTKSGTSMTPAAGSAEESLNQLAKAYADQHKVTFEKAYSAILDTNEGAALYAQL